MTRHLERRFAGVLAQHHCRIVLVREYHPRWGGAFWNIPSGMVEVVETPAEGAVRELAEETGLHVAPSELRLVTTSSTNLDGVSFHAWNFTVDVDQDGIEVNDPDGLVQEARWFALDEAVQLLACLPYRPLSEPAIAILTGAARAGTHWAFDSPELSPRITAPIRP